MERVKLSGDRELIPPTISQKDFVEEMNHHSHRLGHTNKFGECPTRSKIMMLPANDKYRENYKRIFGHD